MITVVEAPKWWLWFWILELLCSIMAYSHHSPELILRARRDSKLSGDLAHFLVWSHMHARTTSDPVQLTHWIDICYAAVKYNDTFTKAFNWDRNELTFWIMLHELPYDRNDSVRSLSDACDFQGTKWGVRKNWSKWIRWRQKGKEEGTETRKIEGGREI